MRKLFILLVFISCAGGAYAQQQMEDVIYLKSGQVIRGRITEQIGDEVRIRVLGKYNFVYYTNEIDKITTEPAKQIYKERVVSSSLDGRESSTVSGYIGILEAGLGFGVGDYGMGMFKLTFINGFAVNENFAIGLGIGIRKFNVEDYENMLFNPPIDDEFLWTGQTLLPIFLDFRYKFSQNKTSPYLALGLGTSLDVNQYWEAAGILINPSFGININTSDKTSLLIGLGLDMQGIWWETYFDDGYSVLSNAFSVNLGLRF